MTDFEFEALKALVLAYGAPAIIEMVEYIAEAEGLAELELEAASSKQEG